METQRCDQRLNYKQIRACVGGAFNIPITVADVIVQNDKHICVLQPKCMTSLLSMTIQGRAHVVKLILDVLPQVNGQVPNRKTIPQPVADAIAGELVNTIYDFMR